MPGRPCRVAHRGIAAPGTRLAPDPPQTRRDRCPDRGEPEGRCQGDSLFPVGQTEQLKILARRTGQVVEHCRGVSFFVVGTGQVDACRVHQSSREQFQSSPARTRYDDQPNVSRQRQLGGQQARGGIAACQNQRTRRIDPGWSRNAPFSNNPSCGSSPSGETSTG